MADPLADFDAWCAPVLEGARLPLDTVDTVDSAAAVDPGGTGTGDGLVLRFPRWEAPGLLELMERLGDAGSALLERPAREIASVLGGVGARFLDPADSLRRRALALLPASTGLSGPMAREVLDGMAADWTAPRLEALLETDLGDPAVLDGFVERPGRGPVRALGARLALHLSSGSVPGVSTTSLVRSLLVKSPVLLKPGRGDVVLPVLFLEALAEADGDLARAAAVLYWRGGHGAAEDAALTAADLVVAYGSDASVASIRGRLPPHVPLVRYHHRASAALVGRDALRPAALDEVAAQAARAVALFDQRGCVSPQVVWVEEGGERSPRDFAEALAGALARLEEELPTGPLDDATASTLQQLRGSAELRAARDADLAVWSGGTAPWTVVYEGGADGMRGGPPRFVRVRPVDDALELGPERLAPLAHHLQTVAVAGLGARRREVAELLARAGAVRVAPLARAPWPPPWWHHDGVGPLRALVRWVDLEPDR